MEYHAEGTKSAQNLRMGPQLEKVRKEVGLIRFFSRLCQRLVEVNEQICQLRPIQEVKDEKELEALKKKLHKQFSARWPRSRSNVRRVFQDMSDWGTWT